MKKAIAVLCLVAGFLLAGVAQAQTTAEPPVQHFIVGGNAASGPVSVAYGGVQLTPKISALYLYSANPNDPGQTRVGAGVFHYSDQLSSFLPGKLKKALLVDTTNYILTFEAGAGKESIANPNGPRISHIVGQFGIFGGKVVGPHTQLGGGYTFTLGPEAQLVKVPVGGLTFTF